MARTPLILSAFALAGAACTTTGNGGDSAATSATKEVRVNLADVLFAPQPDAEFLDATANGDPRFLHVDLGRRGVIRELEFARLSLDASGRTWASAKHDVGGCWRAADEAQMDVDRDGAIIDRLAADVDLAALKTCLSEKGYAGVLLSKPAHYDNGPFGAARPSRPSVTLASAEPASDLREAALGAPIKTSDADKAALVPRAIGLRTSDGGALPARAASAPAAANSGGGAAELPDWNGAFTADVEAASARRADLDVARPAEVAEAETVRLAAGDVHIDVALTEPVDAGASATSVYATALRRADLDNFLLMIARGAPTRATPAAPWAVPLPAPSEPMRLAGTEMTMADAARRPPPPRIEEAREEASSEPVVAAPAVEAEPAPVRLAAAAPARIETAAAASPVDVATPAAVTAPVAVASSITSLPTLDELLRESPARPRNHGAVVFIPLSD